MKMLTTTLVVGLLAAGMGPVAADASLVQQKCASCHALSQPEEADIEARASRRAPPLHYAGDKFRRDWLVAWLQSPNRIRPAGTYPPAHIKSTEEGDAIEKGSFADHIALDQASAEQAADYLMSLRPFERRLEDVDYEGGSIAWRLGQMNFVKFNNCVGCHQDEPGYGGVSGPELYTAWDRLKPSFIFSYISDPVAWDRNTLMPGGALNDTAVEKLANYLKAVAEDTQ